MSKALALRLESVISSLVHLDQTGFIKGRHSSENMQRLFNIIHLYITKTETEIKNPAITLTRDAEKAFDRVGWPFLFTSLNHFDFGSYFIIWIKIPHHIALNGAGWPNAKILNTREFLSIYFLLP